MLLCLGPLNCLSLCLFDSMILISVSLEVNCNALRNLLICIPSSLDNSLERSKLKASSLFILAFCLTAGLQRC